ncbi:MAG TPA: hypothetical protein PLL30_00405 [Candidatus Krumholzibacteria bacterium]|nr:hypothetical protein [Candidatus Krumholzibacteria bacterium]HPD70220.1 hypothetical protein [Candidatus Krumholzibacteria bacterium]HRY40080.1 hypothetical protein [Candidatus Krumholzibacteria bacterium]
MRTLALVTGLLLALATPPALAQKPTGHVGAHWAGDSREGGEDIAAAIEVAIPFSDTGATCDNVDDYDEACPYTGSTSPDLVYTFVAAYSTVADVDLLGSTYDTKVYVYDADLNLVACNDDFYPDYVSKLEAVMFAGGMRYYLVIDGYGGDCGEYVVSVCEILPCDFGCAESDVLEGEPSLHGGYVDTYNGGCDVDPPAFQQLERPAGSPTLHFCGITGYAASENGWQRDSDWFQFTAAGTQVTIDAFAPYSWSASFDVLFLDGCDDVSLLPYQYGSCGSGTIVVDTAPGQVVTLRVRPLHEDMQPCGDFVDEYRLAITGIEGPVAVEGRSWSGVKGMYR